MMWLTRKWTLTTIELLLFCLECFTLYLLCFVKIACFHLIDVAGGGVFEIILGEFSGIFDRCLFLLVYNGVESYYSGFPIQKFMKKTFAVDEDLWLKSYLFPK